MAFGGALGGAFNALAAPVLFDSVAEYVPMMIAGCFLRPSRPASAPVGERLHTLATAALPALLVGVAAAFGARPAAASGLVPAIAGSIAAGLIALTLRRWPLVFGSSLAAMAAAGLVLVESPRSVLHAERSFFGSYRVVEARGVRLLYHGTTIHGAQFADSARRSRPLTYYHPAGPVGNAFETLGGRLAGRRIGVVGLGAGSLLCYGKPGQEWTFFEIDPAVEGIAREPAWFSFMRDCPVSARVVLGDARLTLAREPPGQLAMLVLDAFSSDAIPVHLLTREALAVYQRTLRPDGLLLIHISNKHLELDPVVAALAADAGLVAFIARHSASRRREVQELEYGCDWVLLARRQEDLAPLSTGATWEALAAPPNRSPWTDDYSNIFGAVRW
jgi:hypothetical protein